VVVEILWMTRANPVEKLSAQKFVALDPARSLANAAVDGAFAITFA